MLTSSVRVVRRGLQVTSLVLLGLTLFALAVLGLGPRTGQYRTMTVLSGSMRPTFAPGSVIFTTPLALSSVQVGDVISYQIPVGDHEVVTHRVIEIVEPGEHPVVRTQGDANSSPDPWVARLGQGPAWTVRASVPGAGYALQALRSPEVARVLTWAVPLLLAVVWLRDIWTPRTGRKNDAEPVAS